MPRRARSARRACKRGLPRPLSETDAARAIEEAGEHNVEWLGARDAALLTLLYGAGLRISEALSLKRGDVPLGETLTILGKGRKERSGAGAAAGARRDRAIMPRRFPSPARRQRRCFCRAAASR